MKLSALFLSFFWWSYTTACDVKTTTLDTILMSYFKGVPSEHKMLTYKEFASTLRLTKTMLVEKPSLTFGLNEHYSIRFTFFVEDRVLQPLLKAVVFRKSHASGATIRDELPKVSAWVSQNFQNGPPENKEVVRDDAVIAFGKRCTPMRQWYGNETLFFRSWCMDDKEVIFIEAGFSEG